MLSADAAALTAAGITASYDSGTHILTLSGTKSVTDYQSVLDTVSYSSSSADPANAGANPTRTIEWQATDTLGATSAVQLSTTTTLHFAFAPIVDLDQSAAGSNYVTTFTENGAPVAVADTDISVTDPDSVNLSFAVVTLTNAMAGDTLSVSGALPGGIFGSVDNSTPGQITVSLNGLATPADYQTAIRQVVFSSSSENPNTTDRDVTVYASDDDLISNVAHATIHVVRVNDAPVAANGSASGNEDTAISGTVPVASDVDNTAAQLSYALVGANGGAAHGTVTLNANGTFTYTPAADFNGSDSFSFRANDGLLNSNVATESVTVNPVNDAPVIVSNGGGDTASLSVLENTTAVTTVHATDIDSPTLSYAIVGGSDQALFLIGPSSGVLTFVAAPNFEAPSDSDHNNSYLVQVRASDGSATDTQTLTVNVTNVAEAFDAGLHGDLTGDHNSDVILRAGNGPVSFFSFGGGQQAIGSVGPEWHIESNADFNGDGRTDFLWRADNGTVAVWQMNGATIQLNQTVGAVGNEWHVNGTADFNGDGKNDVLWRGDDGTIAIWQMNGGQIQSNLTVGHTSADWHVVGLGDFNGDGKADILWRDDDGTVALWQMNGGQPPLIQTVNTLSLTQHIEGIGDFNDDGKADILLRNDAGVLAEWQMNGNQIQSPLAISGLGPEWHIEGTGDFNGDNKADILLRNDNGSFVAWDMNGAQLAGTQSFGPLDPALALGVHHYDLL